MTDDPQTPREPWHALLAPLPPGAMPVRTPVAPPEILAMPNGSAIAGWDNVTLELSVGAAGLRYLMVVLDETGRAISASDHVLFRWPSSVDPASPATMRQESIGGRLEADGSFRGTCWLVAGLEPEGDEEPRWEMSPRPPTELEAVALKGLVEEMLRRLG